LRKVKDQNHREREDGRYLKGIKRKVQRRRSGRGSGMKRRGKIIPGKVTDQTTSRRKTAEKEEGK